MSLSVASIPDGIYRIVSAGYSGQNADLVYPGGVDGYIGGWQNNDDSQRMQWKVTNVPGQDPGRVTISNQGVQTYASIPQSVDPTMGTPIVGNPSSTVTWTVYDVPPGAGYLDGHVIFLYDTALVWSLKSGDNGAPVVLDLSSGIPRLPEFDQVWYFVKVE